MKLVNAKSTLVHRRLWPALAAVARSREPWQISGLGPECAELLERVEAEGSVRVESLESYSRPERTRLVKELESRLLVYAKSEHTAQGRHEKVLTSFALWQAEAGLSDSELPTGAEAREALATSVRAWGVGSTAGMLPWLPAEPRTRPRRGRSTRQ